jgi:hypothetical protein
VDEEHARGRVHGAAPLADDVRERCVRRGGRDQRNDRRGGGASGTALRSERENVAHDPIIDISVYRFKARTVRCP